MSDDQTALSDGVVSFTHQKTFLLILGDSCYKEKWSSQLIDASTLSSHWRYYFLLWIPWPCSKWKRGISEFALNRILHGCQLPILMLSFWFYNVRCFIYLMRQNKSHFCIVRIFKGERMNYIPSWIFSMFNYIFLFNLLSRCHAFIFSVMWSASTVTLFIPYDFTIPLPLF